MYIVYIQTDGRTEIYFVIKNVAHLVILLTSSSVAFSDTLKIRASSLNRLKSGRRSLGAFSSSSERKMSSGSLTCLGRLKELKMS